MSEPGGEPLQLLYLTASSFDFGGSSWHALGSDPAERRAMYRRLFREGMSREQLESIRYATRKGVPTGSERFKREIEETSARKTGAGRRGRPKKGL